jgi:predicted RNA-binding protein YlxR (DUF448 family)
VPATAGRVRRVPHRTCVACGSTTNKRDLIRIVRTPAGTVEADPTGKAAGRGAYVCGEPDCWKLAIEKGKLNRSLKTTLSENDAAGLAAYAQAHGGTA